MVEWLQAGGSGLYRKDIQAFNTSTPFVLFYLYTNIMQEPITAEFQKIMEEGTLLLYDGPSEKTISWFSRYALHPAHTATQITLTRPKGIQQAETHHKTDQLQEGLAPGSRDTTSENLPQTH